MTVRGKFAAAGQSHIMIDHTNVTSLWIGEANRMDMPCLTPNS